MELTITRQRTASTDRRGNERDVYFEILMRLGVTEAEREVIRRYKLEGYLLFLSERESFVVSNLLAGAHGKYTSVEVLLSIQTSVREACERFAALVRSLDTFEAPESFAL